jgi:hypothetical protein
VPKLMVGFLNEDRDCVVSVDLLECGHYATTITRSTQGMTYAQALERASLYMGMQFEPFYQMTTDQLLEWSSSRVSED